MSKSLTRRNAIIAGVAGSAIVMTAPTALAEGNTTPTTENGETKIKDKPLVDETTIEPEQPGKHVPTNIPQDTNDVVLQGVGRNVVQTYATMIACSWKGERPDSIEVRALSIDGTWSNWFRLDPISDEETNATEAAWIGESIKTEIRASLYGEDVSDEITAHLIETSENTEDRNVSTNGSTSRTMTFFSTASTTSTYQPGYKAPAVISRKSWGANESYAGSTYTRNSTKGIFLHHTAGTNNYTKAQAAQQVRGMYVYHTRTLGWSDLGYNAVVDKYGQIFEGRKGGLEKNVTGAHSLGFNRESFGVSVMGDYSSRSLPSAAIESVSKIVAWKLAGTFNRNATAKTSFYNTTSGTRYAVNSTARLNIISGHRDVNYTDCPGSAYYRQLPSIRSRVQTLINSSFKGHYNAYVSAGGASKLGTVTHIARKIGQYETTRLTNGLIISENEKNSKAYLSSFAPNWTAAWGRPLVSTSASVQRFEKGTARRENGKVTFTTGGGQYFKDVPDSLIFSNEINTLASHNIIKGWKMKDGSLEYRPMSNVLRDATIVFIYRAMGSPAYTPPTKSPFADVPTNNVFYKEIAWAYSTGITEGWKMRNGTRQFRPFEPIKRDAMAAFLMRAAGVKNPPKATKAPFSDVPTSLIFADEIQWMKSTGISTGWAHNNTYQPFAETKRDAMAAFIYRWMKYTKRL